MKTNTLLYFLHCMTPVHIGAGQGIGAIDMPMIREKVTQWPFFPGSSMKGVHRDYFRTQEQLDSSWINVAFGDSEDSGLAGAVVMSDARILAFPVASQHGTFAYATCPMVLKRLHRDFLAADVEIPSLSELIDTVLTEENAWVYKNSKLTTSTSETDQEQTVLHLDEFEFKAVENDLFTKWTDWLAGQLFPELKSSQDMLKERMVLISDEAFQYFVTMCSEIVSRIRIDSETKTVEKGALWNEEYLPTETLLYGMIWIDSYLSSNPKLGDIHLSQRFKDKTFLQIGGNATVGKGRVRCNYVQGGSQ